MQRVLTRALRASTFGGPLNRLRLLLFVVFAVCPAIAPLTCDADDHITFGIDWRAEAEYGGYYQALATGLYAKHGLDVAIKQGGPQLNQMELMMAGRLDFNLGGGRAIEFVAQKLPFVAITAIFQKDPAVLIAHPGPGITGFASLRGRPMAIAPDARQTWWRFLAARYGYSDSELRPYAFNPAPFLVNPKLVQEGYLTSEPFLIERQGGFKPAVLLAADGGYDGYSNIITTSRAMIEKHPDIVQRFVDASIEGWYSYLYGDPAPANRLIKAANPEMTDDLLAFGRTAMKDHGIVDSGDALTLGIGAMTSARWSKFYREMVAVHVYSPGLDIEQAYTTRFVNRRVGIPSKP